MWNVPRIRTDRGHVESWFVKANHPRERRALWLKCTVLVPEEGPARAEAWCVLFGPGRTWSWRETVPLEEATVRASAPVRVDIAGCTLALGLEGGEARGSLGEARWDLRWTAARDPLCLYPLRAMIEGSLPRTKLLTPVPSGSLSGTLEVGGEPWEVEGWSMAQGHNWGRSHPFEYAWGQCVFPEQDAWLEGFSGRVPLGSRASPLLSALTVRVKDRLWRFDRIVDLWRQRPQVGDLSWTLSMRSRQARAFLSLSARQEEIAALAYPNPGGSISTCLNSKLSSATLRLEPRGEEPLELHSPHGAALELLSLHHDPRFPDRT